MLPNPRPFLSALAPATCSSGPAIYDNVSSRNRMLVFGGLDASGNAISDNSIWALDPTTLTWSQPPVTGGPPSARGGHTMLTYEFALNGKHRTVLPRVAGGDHIERLARGGSRPHRAT